MKQATWATLKAQHAEIGFGQWMHESAEETCPFFIKTFFFSSLLSDNKYHIYPELNMPEDALSGSFSGSEKLRFAS